MALMGATRRRVTGRASSAAAATHNSAASTIHPAAPLRAAHTLCCEPLSRSTCPEGSSLA